MEKRRGFNLIELMIALVVIGILSAICLPIYSQYVVKARRMDAEIGLIQLAQAMEKYSLLTNSYENATLDDLDISEIMPGNYYKLQIASATSDNFSIRAIPLGSQAEKDLLCAELILDSNGTKEISGTGNAAECWKNNG